MKSIWKFPLVVTDEQEILMPATAEILTVQMQGLSPCLWAMVETTDQSKIAKTIRIVGTGHPADDLEFERYIGTFQLPGLVFHVFKK